MKLRWLAVAAAPAPLIVLFGVLASAGGFVGALGSFVSPAGAAGCTTTPPDMRPAGQLNGRQAGYATTIISKGRDMGVPERGWVIAVATAMQESTLDNVGHGDSAGPDSTGLFQQRDSWGPREVRMDPAGAAGLFYRALLAVPDWENLPLYQAAQRVQRSAYPYLYQQWESLAERAVHDLAGVTAPSPTCRPGAVVGGWALPLPAGKIASPVAEHHDYPAADLSLRPGETQPVFAMAAGVAAPMEEPDGCGHGVYVRDGGDVWLYCHLSVQLAVPGQPVGPGVQIGVSGWSGHTEPAGPGGAHLHVQLTRAGKLTCLQPALDALVAGRPVPAVLPTTFPCLPAWRAMQAAS